MGLLDRIAECSLFNPDRYVHFFVANQHVGYTEKKFASRLIDSSFSSTFLSENDKLYLNPCLETPDERTKAVEKVLLKLREMGFVPGWRNEQYPVVRRFGGAPLLSVERAAVSLLGVRGSGVHLNGYVKRKKQTLMWVGKRSHLKPTGPGKFDQIVAGGMPIGISVKDNLIKECWEEASIPREIAKNAQSVGVVTYLTERPDGLRHDMEYVFDLELPDNFVPINVDGEVSDFFLWPLSKVKKSLAEGSGFKFNSGLVAIDFLVRHGYIKPEDSEFVGAALGTNAF